MKTAIPYIRIPPTSNSLGPFLPPKGNEDFFLPDIPNDH